MKAKTVAKTRYPHLVATVTDNSGTTVCTLNILDNGSSSPGTTTITTWAWTFTPNVGAVQNSAAQNPGIVTFDSTTTTVAVDLTVTNNFGNNDSIVTINQGVANCP